MTVDGGMAGINWPYWLVENATMRPLPVNTMASCTPLASRSRVSASVTPLSVLRFSSTAMERARASRSASSESSAARPRFRPASSAVSTRTLNHDSMDRDMNCTDTV
ncbi:hypothetical protein D3C77_662330 [compost metagenome]